MLSFSVSASVCPVICISLHHSLSVSASLFLSLPFFLYLSHSLTNFFLSLSLNTSFSLFSEIFLSVCCVCYVMLCYMVIWLFVKRLSQEAIQRRSQRDRLVKIKV